MKRTPLFSRFAVFLLIPFLAFNLSFNSAYALTGKVIKVADGDSITVLTSDNQRFRVRLYGIDCPERRQPYGSAATRFTREAVAGKDVEVTEYGRDRWGRIVGVVGDLNQSLIEAGLAWVYPQYCKKPFCKDWTLLQISARQERRGLWRDADPLPPWTYRKDR